MNSKVRNVAQSVRDRLKAHSKETGEEFHFVIQRFAMERFLYRLGISSFGKRFILKGASLFFVWKGKNYRVTKDSDLLGYGSPDIDELKKTFAEIAELSPDDDDGLVFSSDLIEVTRMKEGEEYEGARVVIPVKLTQATVKLQVDIGFGDVVVPEPENVQYPTLLSFPPPTLRAYSVFSMISEKFHAMSKLGMANSRMKDFHDICLVSRLFTFELPLLCESLQATFERRRDELPQDIPLAFTENFYQDNTKIVQWKSFLSKCKPTEPFDTLESAVKECWAFLELPVQAIFGGKTEGWHWAPGCGWQKV